METRKAPARIPAFLESTDPEDTDIEPEYESHRGMYTGVFADVGSVKTGSIDG